jgi:hypothetical protein
MNYATMSRDGKRGITVPIWWQILTAGIGLFVAAAAAFVAWHQALTNRLRLQHELFERRFAVFKAVHGYLSFIMQHGGLPEGQERGEKIGGVLDALQRSRFLFKDEIPRFIDSVYKRSIALMQHKDVPAKSTWADDIKFISEKNIALFDVFYPYLRLDIVAKRKKKSTQWRQLLEGNH